MFRNIIQLLPTFIISRNILVCSKVLIVMLFDWQTPVEDVPLAIAPFQGRVLVGVGKLLRIYDLGKKKLLRKCENKVKSTTVVVGNPPHLFKALIWTESCRD